MITDKGQIQNVMCEWKITKNLIFARTVLQYWILKARKVLWMAKRQRQKYLPCNGVLAPPNRDTPEIGNPPRSPKIFNPLPLIPQTFYSPYDWKQKTWRREANAQASHPT